MTVRTRLRTIEKKRPARAVKYLTVFQDQEDSAVYWLYISPAGGNHDYRDMYTHSTHRKLDQAGLDALEADPDNQVILVTYVKTPLPGEDLHGNRPA